MLAFRARKQQLKKITFDLYEIWNERLSLTGLIQKSVRSRPMHKLNWNVCDRRSTWDNSNKWKLLRSIWRCGRLDENIVSERRRRDAGFCAHRSLRSASPTVIALFSFFAKKKTRLLSANRLVNMCHSASSPLSHSIRPVRSRALSGSHSEALAAVWKSHG